MRQILIILASLGLVPAATSATAEAPHASVPPGWKPDMRAAAAYASRRTGTVSFAVRTHDDLWGRRKKMDVNSASVIKALLLVTYLNQPSVRGRALTARDRGLLAPMIRFSDNDSASAVRNLVGAPAIDRLARRARMQRFRLAPAWGLSQINAFDQTRFFLRLPELTPRRHRAYAMSLLASIVPEQRWGVGQAQPRGWKLYFKGGWGAGTGAVSHQVALLRRGRQRVAIAIMTVGSPSHEYSQATLRGTAKRLVRGLARAPRAAPSPEPAPSPSPTTVASPVPAP